MLIFIYAFDLNHILKLPICEKNQLLTKLMVPVAITEEVENFSIARCMNLKRITLCQ